jgi:hypothetical protein
MTVRRMAACRAPVQSGWIGIDQIQSESKANFVVVGSRVQIVAVDAPPTGSFRRFHVAVATKHTRLWHGTRSGAQKPCILPGAALQILALATHCSGPVGIEEPGLNMN